MFLVFYLVFFLLFFFIFFFFFNDTATTEIYTLSLHELFRSRPPRSPAPRRSARPSGDRRAMRGAAGGEDRSVAEASIPARASPEGRARCARSRARARPARPGPTPRA